MAVDDTTLYGISGNIEELFNPLTLRAAKTGLTILEIFF